MRDRLTYWLMACVALLALLLMFADSAVARGLMYALLPAVPMLASLWAMHWVKGLAYIWWYRFAVIWTAASVCAVIIAPLSAKSAVAACAMVVLSAITLGIVFTRFIVPYYRIAVRG